MTASTPLWILMKAASSTPTMCPRKPLTEPMTTSLWEWTSRMAKSFSEKKMFGPLYKLSALMYNMGMIWKPKLVGHPINKQRKKKNK